MIATRTRPSPAAPAIAAGTRRAEERAGALGAASRRADAIAAEELRRVAHAQAAEARVRFQLD